MNGVPPSGVWEYAPAGGRQVVVGVWGYALGSSRGAVTVGRVRAWREAPIAIRAKRVDFSTEITPTLAREARSREAPRKDFWA